MWSTSFPTSLLLLLLVLHSLNFHASISGIQEYIPVINLIRDRYLKSILLTHEFVPERGPLGLDHSLVAGRLNCWSFVNNVAALVPTVGTRTMWSMNYNHTECL